MKFLRKHLQRNLVMDDVPTRVPEEGRKEYKPEWTPESFEVKYMRINIDDHHIDMNDNNCDAVIESSNYFTIMFKNKKIMGLRYEDVQSFEFELVD
jgi:hypothetical protein